MGRKTDPTLNRLISLISRCSQIYFDRELRPMNIGTGQIRILRALDIKDGINQEHIRLLFHLDKGTVAKTIKPLIREGYVTRQKSSEDMRSYRILLTDKGREIMPRIEKTLLRWSRIMTAGLSAEEKSAVITAPP